MSDPVTTTPDELWDTFYMCHDYSIRPDGYPLLDVWAEMREELTPDQLLNWVLLRWLV